MVEIRDFRTTRPRTVLPAMLTGTSTLIVVHNEMSSIGIGHCRAKQQRVLRHGDESMEKARRWLMFRIDGFENLHGTKPLASSQVLH